MLGRLEDLGLVVSRCSGRCPAYRATPRPAGCCCWLTWAWPRSRNAARALEAVSEAEARGVLLGAAAGDGKTKRANEVRAEQAVEDAGKLQVMIEALQAKGLSLGAIAAEPNRSGVVTGKGSEWYPSTVKRALVSLGLL